MALMPDLVPTPDPLSPRIDLLSGVDVGFWCRALDVDHAGLRYAVQHVGPRADAVARYLALRREGGVGAE